MCTYEPRTYRWRGQASDLTGFRVAIAETDLHIQVAAAPSEVNQLRVVATEAARAARRAVESEIALSPEFGTSLGPLRARPSAPPLVKAMYEAGRAAGVGPMAAVAGAIAQTVGRRLLEHVPEVIVENGGDLFLSRGVCRTVAIYAGASPLSERIGVVLPPGSPLGVATSSGTVGHSYSQGCADAALIVAEDAAFADAMATALGNRIQGPGDLEAAVEWAIGLDGVLQALAIVGNAMAVAGTFEIKPLGQTGSRASV